MTYRAVIIIHPGNDIGNIDVRFYSDNDEAAFSFVVRLLEQLGYGADKAAFSIARVD